MGEKHQWLNYLQSVPVPSLCSFRQIFHNDGNDLLESCELHEKYISFL